MCEFKSWLQLTDGTILHLTDAEVYGEFGREKLRGCLHNDYLGHGAIEAFWGQKGEHCENQNFWELDKFPPEIAETFETWAAFRANYGQMWDSGVFQNDDLCYIIRYAPEQWAAKAWERLLTQTPTNGNLCYIIEYAPEPFAAKAWERLLTQTPTNGNLCYIIKYAPEPFAAKAWERLLTQTPTNGNLCYIIEFASEPWKAKAQARKILNTL